MLAQEDKNTYSDAGWVKKNTIKRSKGVISIPVLAVVAPHAAFWSGILGVFAFIVSPINEIINNIIIIININTTTTTSYSTPCFHITTTAPPHHQIL